MMEQFVAALVINELLENENEKKRKKRIWRKEWLAKRQKFSHTNLLRELEVTAHDDYKNFLRMDSAVYRELLQKVKPLIEKKDTQMRDAISANERLSATLHFLATGQSYAALKYRTYISQPALSRIVVETCQAIINVLHEYIYLPRSEDEWKNVARTFSDTWNFPNCLGAIDGKHINIIKPAGSGSYYYNYKKTFSIVLMAVVNAKYEFSYIEVGANGRVSDGGVFSNTKLYDLLQEDKLNLPQPSKVENFEKELSYVFVADDAFPLNINIMKPFRGDKLTGDQEYFNRRLSRARRIVENAFGIISARFRVLLTTIHLSPEKTTLIVLAICYLHNFLRTKSPSSYLSSISGELPQSSEKDSTSLINLQRTKCNNAAVAAKNVRNDFCEYFNTAGKI